jgi:hypothetical protein
VDATASIAFAMDVQSAVAAARAAAASAASAAPPAARAIAYCVAIHAGMLALGESELNCAHSKGARARIVEAAAMRGPGSAEPLALLPARTAPPSAVSQSAGSGSVPSHAATSVRGGGGARASAPASEASQPVEAKEKSVTAAAPLGGAAMRRPPVGGAWI